MFLDQTRVENDLASVEILSPSAGYPAEIIKIDWRLSSRAGQCLLMTVLTRI